MWTSIDSSKNQYESELHVPDFAAQQWITLKYKIVQVSLKLQLAILRSFTVQGLIGVVRVVPPSDANYAAIGLYASTLLLQKRRFFFRSDLVRPSRAMQSWNALKIIEMQNSLWLHRHIVVGCHSLTFWQTKFHTSTL